MANHHFKVTMMLQTLVIELLRTTGSVVTSSVVTSCLDMSLMTELSVSSNLTLNQSNWNNQAEQCFKSLTKLGNAVDTLIIFSLGKMQRDKENQHSYITTFSADRCSGLSDLVDVTFPATQHAPFGLII